VSRRRCGVYCVRWDSITAEEGAPKYWSRHERKARMGMMVLTDASRDDWLEGRGPLLTLVDVHSHLRDVAKRQSPFGQTLDHCRSALKLASDDPAFLANLRAGAGASEGKK
jgi:hypothetical protein